MTPIHSPERPWVLLVAGGSLGSAVANLLHGSDSVAVRVVPDSQVAAPGDAADERSNPLAGRLAGVRAVGLVSTRPAPTLAARLAQACREADIAWLEAVTVAHRFRVGPVVLPGTTPCYACWQGRVRSQSVDPAVDAALNAWADDPRRPWFSGELAALTEEVAAITAAELLAVATDTYPRPDSRMGRYWTGDAIFGRTVSRVFAPIGGCACGVPVELPMARREPAGPMPVATVV